jgi:DNA polymerase III delta prime subunit
MSNFNPEKVCKRASIIFNHYLKNFETLQHMILYGPPGAGKTTTAEWFVNQFWHNYPLKQEVILILNAADERSLESIRQKMYPFAEAQAMACSLFNKPKFIVLDECETLTETAQLALRPLLEYPTNELCLIFICNSLTRVQKQLMNHFLQIRFDPPIINNSSNILLKTNGYFEKNSSQINNLDQLCLTNKCEIYSENSSKNIDINQTTFFPLPIDSIEWRNDYRKQNEISREESGNGLTRFINYLLSSPQSTEQLPEFSYDLSRTLRWCILLAYELDINSLKFYEIFSYLANPDIITEHITDLYPIQECLFAEIRSKFDTVLPPI